MAASGGGNGEVGTSRELEGSIMEDEATEDCESLDCNRGAVRKVEGID